MKRRIQIRIAVLSMVSGACWGLIALALMDFVGGTPHYARGGLIASPLIGLAAGAASARFPSDNVLARLAFSLVSLYASAILFGVGMGVFDLAFGAAPSAEKILEPVLATLWGLTFLGFFIVLWPLAYANHAIIARVWKSTTGAGASDEKLGPKTSTE